MKSIKNVGGKNKQKTSTFYEELVDPFVPGNRDFIIRAEHYARYAFAKKLLSQYSQSSEIVYDIGCGNGYGMKILRALSHQVFGFDKTQTFLQQAQEKYKISKHYLYEVNLEKENFHKFIEHNHIPPPTIIICFETLEHISNPQEVIQSFYNLLPTNGILILSVPNAQNDPKRHGKSKNKFHKQLFYEKDIKHLIENNGFVIAKFFGQPVPNILLHHLKSFIPLLENCTHRSQIVFTILSQLLAFPTRFFIHKSYSLLVVARKVDRSSSV